MAKVTNSFIKSKMNKDLDARLIPNGEYRDALNVQISQSESSDVGTVQNVVGNVQVFSFETRLGVSGLVSIGAFADQDKNDIYLFLTNNTSHFIIKYNNGSGALDILTKGAYLNFNKTSKVYGITLIEDLLFWTDNNNQPRKLNVLSAIADPSYYVNEQTISVAKFSPYIAPSLLDLTVTQNGLHPSTMTNAADLPTVLIDLLQWTTVNLSVDRLNDGTPIEEAQSLSDWNAATGPAWCYYDFNPANAEVYGKIYNEAAATHPKLAPTGYKVADKDDWTNLLLGVGGATGAALKLKTPNSSSIVDWPTFYSPGTWGAGTQGNTDTNKFFNARPGGYRVGVTGGTDFFGIGGGESAPGVVQPQGDNAVAWWAAKIGNPSEYVRMQGSSDDVTQTAIPSSGTPGYYIRCIRDADYDGWNGDPAYMKDKFLTFSYRFKFDDNEYSLIAPFTQAAFVPEQNGYFYEGDEDAAFRSTIVEFMQNNINNLVLNIELPSGSPHKNYKIIEIDIIVKESDGVVYKVIETIPVDNTFDTLYTDRTTTTTAIGTVSGTKIVTTDLLNGIIPGYYLEEINGVALPSPVLVLAVDFDPTTTPPQYEITIAGSVGYTDGDTFSWDYSPIPVYQYTYESSKPYKTLPEREVVRVYDEVPLRALAQETSGNRVMYGNFVANHASLNNLDYQVFAAEKNTQEAIEYPNHNLKQNRNYKVGIVLADKWGRQSDVILSKYDNLLDEFGQYVKGANMFHNYKSPNFLPQIGPWDGDQLRITFNDVIPEAANFQGISGYPGAYAISNTWITEFPVPISPFQAPAKYWRFTQINANGTYEYRLQELFVNWLTTYTTFFNSNKKLRGYYEDYINIISTSTETGGVVVLTTQDRIADSYLFEYSTAVITVSGSKAGASYDINELGYYSYRIVVQQKQQDYYNVYLPGVVNGYPINQNSDEVNKTGHIVLINDNINKIPRDLKEVGPVQTEFNSSVRLYGRVNNLSDGNQQYFPSPTPDTVTLIASQKELFGLADYTTTDIGYLNGLCLYPGFAVEYQETTFDSATPPAPTGSIRKFTNVNPLVARINTVNPIGEAEEDWVVDPTRTYPTSMYLAVYETAPVESVLDIYWETSTTGLISDLNTLVLSSSSTSLPTGLSDIIFAIEEDDAAGTPGSSSFFPTNFSGDIATTTGVLTAVYSKDIQGNLNTTTNRSNAIGATGEFDLIQNSNGSYYIQILLPQAYLTDSALLDYYLFVMEFTTATGETVSLNTDTVLVNKDPSFLPNSFSAPSDPTQLFIIPGVTADQTVIISGLKSVNGSADLNRRSTGMNTTEIEFATVNFESVPQDVTTEFQIAYQNPNTGATITRVSGAAPMLPAFYEITVKCTDPGGLVNTAVIQFTVGIKRYDGYVTWAPYSNQQLSGSDVPNSNPNLQNVNAKLVGGDQGPPLSTGIAFNYLPWNYTAPNVTPQGHFVNTSKRGLVANWTAQTRTIAAIAYAADTTGGQTGKIEGYGLVTTSIPTSNIINIQDYAGAAQSQKFVILATLEAFNPTQEEMLEGVVPGQSGTTATGLPYDYTGCLMANVCIGIVRNTLQAGTGTSQGASIFLAHAQDLGGLPISPSGANTLIKVDYTVPPFPLGTDGTNFPYYPE